MIIKKIAVILCCIILAAFGLGASGAVDLDKGSPRKDGTGTDLFIGVFVTVEPLDLFDWEGFIEDYADQITDGGSFLPDDTAAYQGRIFARLAERTDIDEDTGNVIRSKEYVFDQVDGYPFFIPTVTPEEGSGKEPYRTTCTDDVFSDVTTRINVTDEGTEQSLKGTMNISEDSDIDVLYLNCVYQTAGGEVYVAPGNGYGYSLSALGNVRLSESYTRTVDAETSVLSSEVELSVCFCDIPERVAVLQFDGGHELLDRTEYAPGSVPGEIRTLPGAQYILTESWSGKNVSRALYGPEDEELTSLRGLDNGLCVLQSSQILWQQK